MLVKILFQINVTTWMWMIPFVFFLHEMEEWNILDWYHSTYNPPPKSTKLSCRIWLFIISIWAFVVTALAYIVPNKYIATSIILFLIVFTTFNGLQHIFWTIAFKKYAPGVIFSTLGIICGLIITIAALKQGLVHPLYIILLYALTVPFMIATIKAKKRCIGTFERLHNFTLKIVEVLER
ncbi:MAG: HXXEE domain-containing protein [Lachnospiraceae bacterium]|nr:HXXEE domain-containing protein [Lachnospiraceae bacterium]